MSIDNHDISKMLGISTIDIQTKEMGKQAFHMLENRISGGPPARKFLITALLNDQPSKKRIDALSVRFVRYEVLNDKGAEDHEGVLYS